MKNRYVSGAIACVGAVIGAGFASGREIIAFFSRYGQHSWWLILLSAATMALLSALCMRGASPCGADGWCALYARHGRFARAGSQLCAALMMAVIGGAMVSASGHMVALLWPSEWAYPVGAVGTLVLAWRLGFGGMRPFSWISALLAALFVLAVLAILSRKPFQEVPGVNLYPAPSVAALAWAAVRAVAYAAMNLTIAIGVVCKCSQATARGSCRISVVFGLMMIGLLFVSNYLYVKHPELQGDAFPVVRLLSVWGRAGFVASVALLYLAIFTTLVAIVHTLRNAVEAHLKTPMLSAVVTMGIPLLVSTVGFSEIVDSLYAPAGLCCLALVFFPLTRRNAQTGKPDTPSH